MGFDSVIFLHFFYIKLNPTHVELYWVNWIKFKKKIFIKSYNFQTFI